MRLDILKRLWVFFQFPPQCRHKYPKRSNVLFPVTAPDIFHDKGMGQDSSCVLCQQTQQFLLDRCQMKLFFPKIHTARRIINAKISVYKNCTLIQCVTFHHLQSASGHTKPCKQFFY